MWWQLVMLPHLLVEYRIARLKDLARGPLDAPTQAMLIRGNYRGHVKGGLVAFHADFDVYSLADKSQWVVLLSGVDLQEDSTLDGKAVFPSPNAGPLGGYTLPITGKGAHRREPFIHLPLAHSDRNGLP